ncbi:HNH endonuclease family protein [Nocardia sp. KC 131]|uniref:HNH endonuclease family protein n=1 Tax=Nocardia arseniciresistens TaxID=3392119 RepID=UPI00398F5D0B
MSFHIQTSGTTRAAISRWVPPLFTVLSALIPLSGCADLGALPAAPTPGSPTRVELEQLLGSVRVIDARPHPGGYERSCKSGAGCVFGQSWTDDYDGPGGHDGCDTRNNVLAAQLTGVSFRPGTHDCVVTGGSLNDPYTGKQIPFRKADAGDIQIDHVYPLAAAWDMGAVGWPLERRVQFANDVEVNLLAVDGRTNQSKGDSTPGEWLPPAGTGHCFYAGRYLTVAVRYDLPVTAVDNAALNDIARACP